jgi:hypothetical protein
VNAPPFGGRFEISPASGVAMNTSFYLFAALWSDDVSDYPLAYKFSSYQSDPLFNNLLRDVSTVPYAYVLLSQGIAISSFNVVGVLEVSDSLACSATATRDVQVFPPSDVSNAFQNAQSLLMETKITRLVSNSFSTVWLLQSVKSIALQRRIVLRYNVFSAATPLEPVEDA